MANERYKPTSPFDLGLAEPGQEQITVPQYSFIPPWEAMNMPPPALPSGNDAMNWASILGGLGLGLARPRLAPQALQNFSALGLMQERSDRQAYEQQRLDVAKHEELMKQLVLKQILGGGDMTTSPSSPSFTAPASTAATPPSPPQVSDVPHFAAAMPGSMAQTPQLIPQERMAEQPSQPFFQGAPSPIRGNTSTGLSAYGISQTQSTNRGTEKEQATNNAVNDLTTAWVQNPEVAQRDPRRLLKEVLARNPQADSKEVRQNLSNTLFETYHLGVLSNQPNLDPKTAFREAYTAASQDLGPGMFLPTDQMRTLATQVPSIEERRSFAVGQNNQPALSNLNVVESNTAAAKQGAQNTADFYTKQLQEGAISQVPGAVMGQTMADVAGKPALNQQAMTNLNNLRAVVPQFKRMETINQQIATSKEWKDLAGQKFDVLQAKLLSSGNPALVANINAYEAFRRLFAIQYARALGMVGTQTDLDQLIAQEVIPASGEFGPTARKKWDFIFADLQNRLQAFQPETLGETMRNLPSRSRTNEPPPLAPRLLTPQQQALDAQLNRERPAP